jgi:glycosyltransferase involved in cell wall biosynthesis
MHAPDRSAPSDASAEIILVTPNLGDGGAQRVVSTLANAWSRRGRKVCVIVVYEDDEAYRLDPAVARMTLGPSASAGLAMRFWSRFPRAARLAARAGLLAVLTAFLVRTRGVREALQAALSRRLVPFAPRFASLAQFLPLLDRIQRLRRAVQEAGAPVVVAFTGATNIMTLLACQGLDKRVIVSERNDPARQRLEAPWQALRPRVYKHATVVTANSRGALETMRAYVDDGRLAFVPNPLIRPVPSAEAPPVTAPSVLAVGRLHRQKAHDVLLDAFALAGPRLTGWRLVIVGRGDLEDVLRARAAALGIASRVDWHGQVSDPFPFYRAATVFALPSRHEGTPNALLEAMSCSLPVVVSDASPGPLELVRAGFNGLVIPVDDPHALAAALLELAADEPLRRRLGQAARASVADHEESAALAIWERAIGV